MTARLYTFWAAALLLPLGLVLLKVTEPRPWLHHWRCFWSRGVTWLVTRCLEHLDKVNECVKRWRHNKINKTCRQTSIKDGLALILLLQITMFTYSNAVLWHYTSWVAVLSSSAPIHLPWHSPIWLSGTSVVFLSQRGEHCRPSSFSMSPCLKNSLTRRHVHISCRLHGLAGWEMSAQWSIIERTLLRSRLPKTTRCKQGHTYGRLTTVTCLGGGTMGLRVVLAQKLHNRLGSRYTF